MSSEVKLPWPAADADKYSRGKLVVVAGSARYPGAAALAARAAQRMGAGYVEVVTHKKAVGTVRAFAPSLVVRAFGDWDARELSAPAAGRPCAVCVGPGFEPGKRDDLVRDVLDQARCPVLVDGGALRNLGSQELTAALAARTFPTVLTPHGGEAARLAEPLMLADAEPAKQAPALALALNATVVLKGPDTFVSDGRRTEAVTIGTPALAKAGTGDVLAGMAAALLAQGAPAFDAAFTGATLHALAGVAAAETLTDIATCPEDVIESIPLAIKALA